MRLLLCFNGFILVAALVLAPLDSSRASEPTWQAGLAVAKITPEVPLWLAGYAARDHEAEGTLHDLWVKALALEDVRGRRAVVVTSDVLGFPQDMYDTICAGLLTRCKLDRSQIMLTASHTHSGPALRHSLVDCYPLDDRQRELIDEYSTALEKTVVDTVAKALLDLAPATLWAAEGHTNFAVNRRVNRRQDIPPVNERIEKLEGPNDHGVPVLAVRSTDNQLRAIVFGYACHNTTLASYQWCGDYAGFAQLAIQEKHSNAVAMFYSGCGADQNPVPRRSVEFCQQYGHMLAAAVDEVLAAPMRPTGASLAAAHEFITLDFQPAPTAADLKTRAEGKSYQARWARRMLEKIDRGEPLARNYRYPVQVWRLGSDQLWIALGGEVVVDYALLFQKQYGPTTWVAGYTNDVMAYIPSQRVWEEGGYEAGAFHVYGLPADGWAPGVQQRVTACVDRLIGKLDGTSPARKAPVVASGLN